MWVTAYCDASFRNGRGFWAIWLKSQLGRIVRHGECPEWVDVNTAAEMWAAYTAIKVAKEEFSGVTGVLVVTDCNSTSRFLWPWSTKPSRESMRRIQQLVIGFQEQRNLRIRTKHVKGHQSGNDTSAYLNRKVDELASGRKDTRHGR